MISPTIQTQLTDSQAMVPSPLRQPRIPQTSCSPSMPKIYPSRKTKNSLLPTSGISRPRLIQIFITSTSLEHTSLERPIQRLFKLIT